MAFLLALPLAFARCLSAWLGSTSVILRLDRRIHPGAVQPSAGGVGMDPRFRGDDRLVGVPALKQPQAVAPAK